MKSTNLLQNSLKMNGFFSLVSGLSLLLFSSFFKELLAVQHDLVLPILGGGLVLFAVTVLWTAFSKPVKPMAVKSIIIQDLVWVVGSVIIVVGQFFDLSAIGYELIVVVAVIVGAFAFFQAKGLKKGCCLAAKKVLRHSQEARSLGFYKPHGPRKR